MLSNRQARPGRNFSQPRAHLLVHLCTSQFLSSLQTDKTAKTRAHATNVPYRTPQKSLRLSDGKRSGHRMTQEMDMHEHHGQKNASAFHTSCVPNYPNHDVSYLERESPIFHLSICLLDEGEITCRSKCVPYQMINLPTKHGMVAYCFPCYPGTSAENLVALE